MMKSSPLPLKQSSVETHRYTTQTMPYEFGEHSNMLLGGSGRSAIGKTITSYSGMYLFV